MIAQYSSEDLEGIFFSFMPRCGEYFPTYDNLVLSWLVLSYLGKGL
jgi:hypothetical protein